MEQAQRNHEPEKSSTKLSASAPSSPSRESSSRPYSAAVRELLTNDRLLCGQSGRVDDEMLTQVEAWTGYLAARVPLARLGEAFMLARQQRTDRFNLTAQEIEGAYQAIMREERQAAAHPARSGCKLCAGQLQRMIYDPRTDTETLRWCPQCRPDMAKEQGPLPKADIHAVQSILGMERMPGELDGMLRQGLCPSCLDTGYVYSERGGRRAVVGRMLGYDDHGRERIELMRCDCPKGAEKRSV